MTARWYSGLNGHFNTFYYAEYGGFDFTSHNLFFWEVFYVYFMHICKFIYYTWYIVSTRVVLHVKISSVHQMGWEDIQLLVKTAQDNNDPIASCIKELKLKTNHITLLLSDPYDEELEPMCVDIDLSLTAFANARR